MNELIQYKTEAEQFGLVLRGGFEIDTEDSVPPLEGDRKARTLLLFGNAGSSLWPRFSVSAEYEDGEANPLNRWSQRIGCNLAEQWGGIALFPFGGPPYQPFLRWAKKAESLESSVLGILMHPSYGLWHAYRFAIALPMKLAVDDLASTEGTPRHACDSCQAKPCLDQCPVNAFTAKGYDVESCFNFLDSNPLAPCHSRGCQARTACPEGLGYLYEPDHAAFHMEKFYHSLESRFS